MKRMLLGVTLALFVHLQPAMAADFIGPVAPKSVQAQIGTSVPEFGMLARKTAFSLAGLTLFFLLVTGTFKRFAKSRGTLRSEHEIEVIARRPVGQRQALLVVAVDGRKFLLSQGTEDIRLVSELEAADPFANALDEGFELIGDTRRVANKGEV